MNMSDYRYAVSIARPTDPVWPLLHSGLTAMNCHELNDLLFERLSLATVEQMGFSKELHAVEFLVTPVFRHPNTGNLTILNDTTYMAPVFDNGLNEHCPIHDLATNVHRSVIMDWNLMPSESPSGIPISYTWDQLVEGSELVIVGATAGQFNERNVLRVHAVILMRGHFMSAVKKCRPDFDWIKTDDKLDIPVTEEVTDLNIDPALEFYLRKVGFVEAVILQPGLS
jgi:hypothetical protein